jgi:streptogramin lyase
VESPVHILVSLLLPSLLGASPSEPPRISGQPTALAALAYRETTVRIDGHGFGQPRAGRRVKFRYGRKWYKVRSVSKKVVHWDDRRIILRHPRTLVVDEAYVTTENGDSIPRSVDSYAYDWFEMLPGRFHPTQIAHDPAGRVWIHAQFQKDFHFLDVRRGVVKVEIPFGPDVHPFAMLNNGAWYRTRTSATGEDITVDDEGVVYLAQSGYTYDAPLPNHSRIVRHDPNAPAEARTRVYNVPGDNNHVWGLEWDRERRRLWFLSNRNRHGPAKLTSFDPDAIAWDNEFDFSTSLDHQICPPGGPDDGCYREYALPDRVFMAAHVAIDHAGFVWYTAYWGTGSTRAGRTEIGRLDPETGEVRSFPVPDSKGSTMPMIGAGPWDIEVAPNGDIVYTESFDGHLGRFDISRVDDAACQSLDDALQNPCIVEISPSGDHGTSYRIHSIDHDARGNVWFGHQNAQPDNLDSLSYVTPEADQVVHLPPMAPYAASGVFTAAGISINHGTGEIWFSESNLNRRIGRLRPLN